MHEPFTTTDVNLAAYLALRGVQVNVKVDHFVANATAWPVVEEYTSMTPAPFDMYRVTLASGTDYRFARSQYDATVKALERLQAKAIERARPPKPFVCPAGYARVKGFGWLAGDTGP